MTPFVILHGHIMGLPVRHAYSFRMVILLLLLAAAWSGQIVKVTFCILLVGRPEILLVQPRVL